MTEQERIDLVTYRIKRAKETFEEVSSHIENKLWNTAVNRLYYACFYAVSALLINQEIRASTHSGVRQMLGLHFIKAGLISQELGKFYSDIFDMRQSGDYGDYIDFSEADVLDLLNPSGRLITRIEHLLKDAH